MEEINNNVIPETLIDFRNVSIRNGDNMILQDVSFSVQKGDFVYIVGRVGSGKSSLIKSMIGEYEVGGGMAMVAGYDLKSIKSKQIPFLRRATGVVFQDFKLLMDRDIYHNLEFVLKATGWNDEALIKKRIDEVLTAVGMETKQFKMAFQLSGGEQQRVAIARAILNSPSLILADEPTGSLDPQTQGDIMSLFIKIHQEQHPAIVFVTHNMHLLGRYRGRVFKCDNGMCREVNVITTTRGD